MKKFLLIVSVAIMTAIGAQAQIYTALAHTEVDQDWAPNYDGNIMLDNPVVVEGYDGYVIIKSWLGDNAKQDLKVEFDDEDNVTAVTPINSGIEGNPTTSGYAAFSTNSSSYYYVQLYLGEQYDYAASESGTGYVILSGYFYKSSTEYSWMYYFIEWEREALHTTAAQTQKYPDADFDAAYNGVFMLPAAVPVTAYDNFVEISDWAGTEGYNLSVYFDQDAMVTSIVWEYGDSIVTLNNDSVVEVATGNAEYPTVKFSLDEGMAFAYTSQTEGYVLLSGTFTDASGAEKWMYYYLPFDAESGGINAIDADNLPAELYNIRGMRITNPTPGQIVISRRGNTVTKYIAR